MASMRIELAAFHRGSEGPQLMNSSMVNSSMWEGLIPHLHCSISGYHQTPQPADFRCFPVDCCIYHSEELTFSLKVSIQNKEDNSSYLK